MLPKEHFKEEKVIFTFLNIIVRVYSILRFKKNHTAKLTYASNLKACLDDVWFIGSVVLHIFYFGHKIKA